MLAYKISPRNLDHITTHNDGVPIKFKPEDAYFITATGGSNRVVTEEEFNRDYSVRLVINENLERYRVFEN